MKNVLVTGVSSGIGNTLTKLLIKKGFIVWGIARRRKLLEILKKDLNSNKFIFMVIDIAENKSWEKIIKNFKKNKFIPDVVIFNAALHENDLKEGIDLDKLRSMMEVNFFSVMKGVNLLSVAFKNRKQFITLSSTSAFKGNHKEGIGYAASKGALSIAFESLFQKYLNTKNKFTTIFFGPVETDMLPFDKRPPFMLSKDKASEYILNAIYEKKPFYYYPKSVFAIISIMRLLPKQFFLKLWTTFQKLYINTRN